MIDQMLAEMDPFQSEPGTSYRIAVPCALYISADSPDELRARLEMIFGENEWWSLRGFVPNESGDAVFFPGWNTSKNGNEQIYVADTERDE